MAQFDRSIATAKRLIAKYGQAVTWRQITDVLPDPNEPWNPGEPEIVNNTVVIAFLPVGKEQLETLRLRPGTEVPKVSEMGYMFGGVEFEPNMKDVVVRNGVELSIVYIDELHPNGQEILYTVLFAA